MTSDLYIENKVKLSHNVVRAIRNELSLEKEISLKLDDLLKITSLHVVDITNDVLEQITHFTNLVNLSLCFLGDVDLLPLQNLHALKYLSNNIEKVIKHEWPPNHPGVPWLPHGGPNAPNGLKAFNMRAQSLKILLNCIPNLYKYTK